MKKCSICGSVEFDVDLKLNLKIVGGEFVVEGLLPKEPFVLHCSECEDGDVYVADVSDLSEFLQEKILKMESGVVSYETDTCSDS